MEYSGEYYFTLRDPSTTFNYWTLNNNNNNNNNNKEITKSFKRPEGVHEMNVLSLQALSNKNSKSMAKTQIYIYMCEEEVTDRFLF